MLKFINNNNGVIGLTISQIGLIIATAVILAAVFSFLYFSDFKRTSELKNIASGFSIMVEGMDTRFFENTTLYFFPDKDYSYNLSLNSEYLIVNADGSWMDNKLSVKERFLINPWPRKNNSDWVSEKELHSYLKNNYGQTGNITDPIQGSTNINKIKDLLNTEFEDASYSLALNPYYINRYKPVYISKTFIYYNTDGTGGWDKNSDENSEFILIYQKL